MRAVARSDWQEENIAGSGGGSADHAGAAGIDRQRLGAALLRLAGEVARLHAPLRPSVLQRAWVVGEHLARPVDFLLVGRSPLARDAMRFLAGMDAAIPDDLASVVACLRVVHGAAPELRATSGAGLDIPIPSEPIMLTPHAPVTLIHRATSRVLKTMQFTHLRNLGAGCPGDGTEPHLDRADAAIWLSDATDAWSEAEEALFRALPVRLSGNAVLVLTDAERATAAPERRALFDRKVELLAGRFRAVLPLALPAALKAAPGGVLADAALFGASGAPALLTALRRIEAATRAAKDAEAARLVDALGDAREAARRAAAEARARAEAEARARAEAAARAEAEAAARTEAEAEAAREAPDGGDGAPPVTAPAPSLPRLDDTALAILREEAEREARARRREAGEAPAPPAPPAPPPAGQSGIADFLAQCAADHADLDLDTARHADRLRIFDEFLNLISGLATRLRDPATGIREGDRLLGALEEAEDTIMLLSCEGDAAALRDGADLVAQMIADIFDRQPAPVTG